MGLFNTKEEMPDQTSNHMQMFVYIPSWDRYGTIGVTQRTTSILNIPFYLGGLGNRRNDFVSKRDLNDINRIAQGVGSLQIISEPENIFNHIPSNTQIVFMETLQFWKDKNIEPISLFDIQPKGNLLFVFGNEADGIDEETFKLFENSYVPSYLPQDEDLINYRKRNNSVSLNLAHAVTLTLGIMLGKNSL